MPRVRTHTRKLSAIILKAAAKLKPHYKTPAQKGEAQGFAGAALEEAANDPKLKEHQRRVARNALGLMNRSDVNEEFARGNAKGALLGYAKELKRRKE